MVTTTASSPKQHLPFFPARLSDGGLAGQAQSPDPSHRQGAPSLARAPRPSEGWDVTANLYWPKAMSVRSSALQVGEVKLQLEEGSFPLESVIGVPTAGAPPFSAQIGRGCRQSGGTDLPFLSSPLGATNSRVFPADQPVALLSACSRDLKHRRRQSCLPTKKAPPPPSVS